MFQPLTHAPTQSMLRAFKAPYLTRPFLDRGLRTVYDTIFRAAVYAVAVLAKPTAPAPEAESPSYISRPVASSPVRDSNLTYTVIRTSEGHNRRLSGHVVTVHYQELSKEGGIRQIITENRF